MAEAWSLKVKRLADEAILPRRAHPQDAGLDLFALEPAELPAAGRVSVPTGLALEVPAGHAGLVLPRSGLAAKHGITVANAPGLIDSGYRGELRVLLLNTSAESFTINAGDRIAQLVIVAVELPVVVDVQALSDGDRGSAGFGSSGGFGPSAADPLAGFGAS
ncbi:dUTP diphosphatase [Conexibacter sp. S30A1]|uniref:dUTP diphosphatase n=1 Tax=Conexibacter sp. S30A1 TaxID=2937800 RepID=UPI002010052A|nr:dUTP diphosphatase [Conexibacter sp. S30A1]